MKISVIIPTFNREQFILRAINSVLEQTYLVDEIIIVDDGSTDNTYEIIKELQTKHKNIIYIKQANHGVSKARNSGIKNAKNSWVAFLDSDDTWHKDKIQEHLIFHKNNPLYLCSYTDELWIRNGKTIKLKSYQEKDEPTFMNSLRLCKIGTSSFFTNKKVFDEIGFFDEKLEACEDYDLWLRILLKYNIKYINKTLVTKYAGHKNQLSFETPLIDTYRIEALEKHLSCEHKNEVLNELRYKIDILIKGAKKRDNTLIINKFEAKLEEFSNLG